jgi:hypothetical protein
MNIKHNAIPHLAFQKIKMELFSDKFPWYFIPSTAYPTLDQKHIARDFSLGHTALRDGGKNSAWADILETAVLSALSETTDENIIIHRIRVGLITATKKPYIHEPHVDFDFPHMTALFYLNDCDGDTIFYNELLDPSKNLDSYGYYKKILKSKVTVQNTVTPTENTMAWFNGLQYHSSTTPTTKPRRLVINVNYDIRDKDCGQYL